MFALWLISYLTPVASALSGWTNINQTGCSLMRTCRVVAGNKTNEYDKYDCVNNVTRMVFSACGDKKYAVDAKTAIVATGTFEDQLVRAFYACYEHLLCTDPCKYKSGIKTLVAAKGCASAALARGGASYPIEVPGKTAIAAMNQPNAVALLADSIAHTCNFTDDGCVYGANRKIDRQSNRTFDYTYTSCRLSDNLYKNNVIIQTCDGNGGAYAMSSPYEFKNPCDIAQHFFDVAARFASNTMINCRKPQQTLKYCYDVPDCQKEGYPTGSRRVIASCDPMTYSASFMLPVAAGFPSISLPMTVVVSRTCESKTSTTPTSTTTTTTETSPLAETTTLMTPVSTTSTSVASPTVVAPTSTTMDSTGTPSTSTTLTETSTSTATIASTLFTETGSNTSTVTAANTAAPEEPPTKITPFTWPVLNNTTCDEPNERSVPICNGSSLSYARYDCANYTSQLEMPVSRDLNFTITVNTTQLNGGTLESDIVKVYISCYKQRLETNKICQNESALHTMMALKDCASAALGSYPVTVVNSTYSTAWPASPDAVAVIVENDAKICNYSDAIYQHGAFQTSSAWSDTPLVVFFAVRELESPKMVPFEAAILAEACNGSLWAVIAPSKNVSSSIGDDIPLAIMKNTFNSNCSSYRFVSNLVEQIAWNAKREPSCSARGNITFEVPLCLPNNTSKQTPVMVQFRSKPDNWTTVPTSSRLVNGIATCTGTTTTSRVPITPITTTASSTLSTPTVPSTDMSTASSKTSPTGTATNTATVPSTIARTAVTSTTALDPTTTGTSMAPTTTSAATITTEPSSSTGTASASIAATTKTSSTKLASDTSSSTTQKSTSTYSSTQSPTTTSKPSTETETYSVAGTYSSSTASTGTSTTASTTVSSAVTTEFEASRTPTGHTAVELTSTTVQSASTAETSTAVMESSSPVTVEESAAETSADTTSPSTKISSTTEASAVSSSLSPIEHGSTSASPTSPATLTTASTTTTTPKETEEYTSTEPFTSTMPSSPSSSTTTSKATESSTIPATTSTKRSTLAATSEVEMSASSRATTAKTTEQSSTTAEHTTTPTTTMSSTNEVYAVSSGRSAPPSSTTEATEPTFARSSKPLTEDREDISSTVQSTATSDTTTITGTSTTLKQSPDTSVHEVSSTVRTTTGVSNGTTEQAATLASTQEEAPSTVPDAPTVTIENETSQPSTTVSITERTTDMDTTEPTEANERSSELTSTTTVETSTQSTELPSSSRSSSSESDGHTMTKEATLQSTIESTALDPEIETSLPGHSSPTYGDTSTPDVRTSPSTTDEMLSSTLSAATPTADQSKTFVSLTNQATVTSMESIKTAAESSTLAIASLGSSTEKTDETSDTVTITAKMPTIDQTTEAGPRTSESTTITYTIVQTEAATSETTNQTTDDPTEAASTERSSSPTMSTSEAPTSMEASSTSTKITESSLSASPTTVSQSVGTSSQAPHMPSDSPTPREDVKSTSSSNEVTTEPESSIRATTESEPSATTSEEMLLSTKTTSSASSAPTSTVTNESRNRSIVSTTTKRPQQTTTPKACEQECEDGWTPGKGIDCYKFIDASTSPTSANWTYLDFDQVCTAIGQSQVYMKDFDNDDLYELYADLSGKSASKNKLVYSQMLPTPEYRQERTVKYVDLSANVYLRREEGTVANNALLPNISAICRKPKFCADYTCKVADYVDEDVPQTRYLKMMKNVTSLQPGETIMMRCTTNSGQFKLTCNQRGYLQPHPSTLDCQSKNETSSTTDAALPNIRVKNCTQCFKMGTENCTQGDGFAVCECKPGWRSSICLFTEDFCSADPCLNGGTCENDVDDYLCHCQARYKGRRCEIDTMSVNDPTANAVYKQLTTKDTLLAVWTTICAVYIKYRAADRKQGNTPQETLQQSREVITGVALALNAWFRNPTRCLMGEHTDELGCRMFYWAINSLFLTCMCLMYHEAENMYGVLQGRWHNVWAPGNIDFAVRIFGSISVGFGTTAAIMFYYWDELPQPASCIGGFHDSAQSATVIYFGIGTVLALLTCWRLSQSFFAWQSEYFESVRYHKVVNEDLGRLWVIHPRNYAIVTQPVENNVFLLGPTLISYWLSWAMTVYANDAFSTKIAIISLVVSGLYAFVNTVQTYVTDPEDFRSLVEFLMVKGPCMWTPEFDHYNMKMWSEVVAEKKPELLEQTVEDIEKAEKEYRKKEHDWIDRVNDAIRTTYAAVHGVPRKRVPKKLLLHKPEQGPKRIDSNKALREQFDWMNPSDPSYIPVHLRKWWFDWWTKDYLQQRKSLPRRENFPWEAAKNVHREHWCTIHTFGPRDTEMCQLFYLWAIKTVKSDNYKTNDANLRDVMRQGLNALTMGEINPQLEVTENFGPAPAPLVKEKQIRKAIEEDRERDAEENAEWDKVYEDDPEPGLKEPVQFKRNGVTGEKINTNPRKKPLTDEQMLAMESKVDFIGPRLRNKQLPPGVRPSAIKRMEVQQHRDMEWEETKEADRLQQVTELWRRKTLPWLHQLLGIPYASDEEVRLNLPNELRNDQPGTSRAAQEQDEQQQKQQEFARKLQEDIKKEK